MYLALVQSHGLIAVWPSLTPLRSVSTDLAGVIPQHGMVRVPVQ